MKLKDLTTLLIQLPTMPTLALVARAAGVGQDTVMEAVREGIDLGYVEVRKMPTFDPVISLTPLGAERERVVLIEVRIADPDDPMAEWREEPRWLPIEGAWWLLEEARRIGYPVLVEDPIDDADDRRVMEPIEY